VTELAERLRAHVRRLSHEIGDRNMEHYEALQQAAGYITASFEQMGYSVRRQAYSVQRREAANLIATATGVSRPEERVVIGAHYDTCFNPGADDNASGIAGLLEIARALTTARHERSVEFVAFVNEEPPYFQTEAMGSAVFVRDAMSQARGANAPSIHAAVILEMIGYYSDAPRSQHYPPLFGLFYPDRGNFLAVVGNFRSLPLVRRLASSLTRQGKMPTESLATFESIPGVAWSDQWAFWRSGIPAVMVTDTAFFRNPHYHLSTDTWDTLNYPVMAQAVEALTAAILDLADAPARQWSAQ
jgi:Zn-dependent M28 family amino/carboxypeptidase